jgi:Secretion system C-terminal sorting domain
MKLKFYFSFLILSLFGIESKAQLTADFPDSNYFYNETRYERGSDLTDYNAIDYSIYYKKDSTVNNVKYHVLNIRFTIDYFNPVAPNSNGDIEFALLRNDKANKKVYIKGLNNNLRFNLSLDTSEKLLYDFSLMVGDKFSPNAILHSQSDSLEVIGIDSIIDEQNIKRAVYTIFPKGNSPVISNGYIIQGVGGLKGLIGFPFEVMNNVYQEQFNCVNVNGISYKVNFAGPASSIEILSNSCNLHVFTGVSLEREQSLLAFPNPSSNYINISSANDNLEYTIRNVFGQIQVVNSSIINKRWQLDIRNLPNGLYFINAVSNNIHYYGKFIKQ